MIIVIAEREPFTIRAVLIEAMAEANLMDVEGGLILWPVIIIKMTQKTGSRKATRTTKPSTK